MSMNSSAKKQYQVLADNGELLEMFPGFTGKWSKDKKEFIKFHELNEEVLSTNIEIDLEDGAEEIYED